MAPVAVPVPRRPARRGASLSLDPFLVAFCNERSLTAQASSEVIGYSGRGLSSAGTAAIRFLQPSLREGSHLGAVRRRGSNGWLPWLPVLMSSREGTVEAMVYCALAEQAQLSLLPAASPELRQLYPVGVSLQVAVLRYLRPFDNLACDGPWLSDRLVALVAACNAFAKMQPKFRRVGLAQVRSLLREAGVVAVAASRGGGVQRRAVTQSGTTPEGYVGEYDALKRRPTGASAEATSSTRRRKLVGDAISVVCAAPGGLFLATPLLIRRLGWLRGLFAGVVPFGAAMLLTVPIMHAEWSESGEWEDAAEPFKSFVWFWSRLQTYNTPLLFMLRHWASPLLGWAGSAREDNSPFTPNANFRYFDGVYHDEESGARLLIGGLPLPHHVLQLYSLGVRAVVNCCEEFAGWTRLMGLLGIEQLRLSVVDYTEVPLQELEEAVEWMDNQLSGGRSVYVHCKAGVGRSGTCVVAFLGARRSERFGSAEAAFEFVMRERKISRVHERAAVKALVMGTRSKL